MEWKKRKDSREEWKRRTSRSGLRVRGRDGCRQEGGQRPTCEEERGGRCLGVRKCGGLSMQRETEGECQGLSLMMVREMEGVEARGVCVRGGPEASGDL